MKSRRFGRRNLIKLSAPTHRCVSGYQRLNFRPPMRAPVSSRRVILILRQATFSFCRVLILPGLSSGKRHNRQLLGVSVLGD